MEHCIAYEQQALKKKIKLNFAREMEGLWKNGQVLTPIQNHKGWKRPLRSPWPTDHPPPPCPLPMSLIWCFSCPFSKAIHDGIGLSNRWLEDNVQRKRNWKQRFCLFFKPLHKVNIILVTHLEFAVKHRQAGILRMTHHSHGFFIHAYIFLGVLKHCFSCFASFLKT